VSPSAVVLNYPEFVLVTGNGNTYVNDTNNFLRHRWSLSFVAS
jgi:hypothetical protein